MKHSEANDSEFVALLTEHQSSLRYYVASLLPGDSAAADVAQQANATIWKKRDDFELGTNFKAWIFSIARYEVLNYRKKDSRDRLVFTGHINADTAAGRTEVESVQVSPTPATRSTLSCHDRTVTTGRRFIAENTLPVTAMGHREVGEQTAIAGQFLAVSQPAIFFREALAGKLLNAVTHESVRLRIKSHPG